MICLHVTIIANAKSIILLDRLPSSITKKASATIKSIVTSILQFPVVFVKAVLNISSLAGFYRVLFGDKAAKVNGFIVVRNSCNPFLGMLVPANTSEATRIKTRKSTIFAITSRFNISEVSNRIINPVMVNMVNLCRLYTCKNLIYQPMRFIVPSFRVNSDAYVNIPTIIYRPSFFTRIPRVKMVVSTSRAGSFFPIQMAV